LFTNPLLLGAIIIGLLIQASLVYVPFFHDVFGIYVVGLKDWGFVIGISLIPVIINEIYKGIRRII
jgi:Ca2+-transporting ATPase